MKRLLELDGTECTMLKGIIRNEIADIKKGESINKNGYLSVFNDILDRLEDPDMNNAECERMLGR